MAILQVQSISGTWREVGRCANDSTIIAKRLDELKRRYKDKVVRAVDSQKRLLDTRM